MRKIQKILRTVALLCLGGTTVFSLLCSCGGKGHDHEEAEEHDHEHEGAIEMCASEQKSAGVVCSKIEAAPFAKVLHTSGRIVTASQGVLQVSAPVAGVVSGLSLNAGRNVTAGSRLLSITATAQQKKSAQIELDAARTALERLERLAADKLVGADELEAARTRLRQAEVATQFGDVAVTIPATGTLQSLAASNGQIVEAGAVLATVNASGRSPMLDVAIPVHHNTCTYTSARFKCANQTGTADGFVGVNTQIDTDGCVHATFSGLTITPPIGAYCEVWLMGAEREDVLSVPLTALTEDQGTHYIYTRAHEDCFLRQAVTLGQSDGERVEITAGVQAGDMVVTEGAYAVRAAGQSAAIPGHTHNH